jgi:beta-glucosidase
VFHPSQLPRPVRPATGALSAVAALALCGSLLPTTASASSATASASSASASKIAIGATAVTTVAQGGTATVKVELTGAGVLSKPVQVRWRTGQGSAVAGRDFRASSGTVVFAAGSRAGASRMVKISTLRTKGAANAKTLAVQLSPQGATLSGAQPAVVINAHGLAYQNRGLSVAARVRDLLSRMTLAEKVGQMTQAERAAVDTNRPLITTWNLGSLLSGGGSTPATNDPQAWADMVDAYQSYALKTRLQIPLIYGIDAVHGHNNVKDATLFPHNIGLGSTRDPQLVRRAEQMAATETRATGIPWAFAPCLCVARDDRWGRTYESFGEDPSLVIKMETSIDGLQGTTTKDLASNRHVLASAKHFAGDGDTTYGSGRNSAGASSSDYPIDQGITQRSWAHFARVDLSPYVPAVQKHHVGTIMPSYSSVDYTDDGLGNPIKMHANRELIRGWLESKVGFDGFIISDYNAIHQIPPTSSTDSPTPYQVRTAVNAGVDMAMEPNDYQKFETRLIAEVNAGNVTMERINDAVSRILTKKFQLGLFEHPFADRSLIKTIGSPAHRKIARQAAAESQVLLKNAGGVLPLRRNARVYVAGRNADNLGNQAGGWTITWQGQSGNFTKGTTILQGMRQVAPGAQITYSLDASAPMTGSDVGVVVVGETPYAEGYGDVGGPQWAYDPSDKNVPREPKTMELKAQDRATIDKVCTALPKCVVLVVSGRPQVLTDQLSEIDGLVASWLPGTEGEGVADVLFGNRGFTGQLSQSWPRSGDQEPINVGDASYNPLFPFGWGLSTKARDNDDGDNDGDDRDARSANGLMSKADLRQAKLIAAGHSSGTGSERQLVNRLRLAVERRTLNPGTGVAARPADRIARADVATLRGDYRTAISLLIQALGG